MGLNLINYPILSNHEEIKITRHLRAAPTTEDRGQNKDTEHTIRGDRDTKGKWNNKHIINHHHAQKQETILYP